MLHIASAIIFRTLSPITAFCHSQTSLLQGFCAAVVFIFMLNTSPRVLISLLLNSPPLSLRIVFGGTNIAIQCKKMLEIIVEGFLLFITMAVQSRVAKSIITKKYLALHIIKSIEISSLFLLLSQSY